MDGVVCDVGFVPVRTQCSVSPIVDRMHVRSVKRGNGGKFGRVVLVEF